MRGGGLTRRSTISRSTGLPVTILRRLPDMFGALREKSLFWRSHAPVTRDEDFWGPDACAASCPSCPTRRNKK